MDYQLSSCTSLHRVGEDWIFQLCAKVFAHATAVYLGASKPYIKVVLEVGVVEMIFYVVLGVLLRIELMHLFDVESSI